MDMKRILQAFDGASTRPVESASSMSKLIRIVSEADINQPAATPQQDPNFAKYAELMAKYDMLSAEMTPDASGVAKNASPEFVQQVTALKARADQLAGANAQAWEKARKAGSAPQQSQQQLATQLEEDILVLAGVLTESALKDKEDYDAKRKALQDIQMDPETDKDPELKAELVRRKADLEKEAEEKGIKESTKGFKEYLNLVEAKKMSAKEDPCWTGYKMVGKKKKGGKEVPNCVPGKKGD